MRNSFLLPFVFLLVSAIPASAQLSVAAHCQRSCEQQNPDPESAAYQQCLDTHCAEAFAEEANKPVEESAKPPAPPASLSASGSWSVVGMEERAATVRSAISETTLNYDCDGRGGHYVELAGVPIDDRIIGMIFDNGSAHFPTFSKQPTGFQIKLWKDHPLIQAIKSGSAVRVFERDGSVIGDYSLANSSRAIAEAERNCGT